MIGKMIARPRGLGVIELGSNVIELWAGRYRTRGRTVSNLEPRRKRATAFNHNNIDSSIIYG